ncbi:hypothetical protein T440DRAFT_444900 [Plenodomus tracheiphilus IPT5]|uniref:DNA 3'-5' helicase n=1 Tax=Plenodomus tracheiphilus IPT5 TaxID=1408161 RepID=A0A6A7BC57_9PLEO|nr:hypothetical protein T440DRAFT_444900 [Plenodomus tracheiphilus IPT5]
MITRSASGTLGGVSMKHLSLATLTFQNSALILIMHYSRVMPLVGGQRYHASTSVFLNEVIKLGISLSMALYDMSKTLPPTTTIPTLFRTLTTAIFTNESWKLAIPAVLYTIQNNLQYVAVSNLDAATFQVTYQLKILTTAIFSVLMLGRVLSPRKWLSLVLLIVGVSIIQVPQATAQVKDKAWAARTLEKVHDLGSKAVAHVIRSGSYEGIHEDRAAQVPHMNAQVGLIAVLVACALSGLAGVTFEKILKDSTSAKPTSLWVRNCQLSFWSLFPSLFLGVIWKDGEIIAKTGFFAGYNWVVWTAICFQAAGGVIVALVINYADNIAKNFATSISILLSCIASVYFFDFQVTTSFFLGTSVVLFATYLYTKPERTDHQSPLRIAEFEKTTTERSPTHGGYDADYAREPAHVDARSSSPALLPVWAVSRLQPLWAVMSNEYYHHNNRQAARPARSTSHYDMLRPRFTQPERQIPPRDRYRSTQYHDPMYDIVDDEESYDRGAHFDSFDEELLQQPYEDRQRQAVQGRGRLSLAPGPSRFFSQAPPLQSQPLYQARDLEEYGGSRREVRAEDLRGQLRRFAYNADHPQESSSEMQVGLSSSPALRAGQRRADHSSQEMCQYKPEATHIANKRQHARQQPDLAASHFQDDKTLLRMPSEGYEQRPTLQQKQRIERPFRQLKPSQAQPGQTGQTPTGPLVQGIPLVPIMHLPDRLRSVFPYPTFNAVQSKCFQKVFQSDGNFVLASPTGSGKTVILELAICRALVSNATDQYKIVYQAPTKALCSERQRDWEKKFQPIGLKCAELTGDSDATDLRNVQMANIIITTPEKWDSMTRKWKDHEKLMRLIKLFLIDEVHILKEDRGAVLEVVVSRTKSIATDVRFVALSATVPNFHDVAAWLGKRAMEPDLPAAHEKFGEEFRPVKLQKHVCGYVSNQSNDFAFEKTLDGKLPGVITKYSEGKPIMVFCATRKSTANTAKLIANWWQSTPNRSRFWDPPQRSPNMSNKELRDMVTSGVAFHHAGLDQNDRVQIEKSFIAGELNVICCTSTLAVGVNLPCHLVIIKNTVAFTGGGMQEYSDLEMIQMLGRAGRPQFDDSAVAVIMTRQAKVNRYEKMVTGEELLESKLHLNLIDHMNAEIGLGTISDFVSARRWLKGTFLYVRLQQNPNHYKLEGARSGQSVEEQIDEICARDINLLRDSNLASGEEYFRSTEFGHAMARYYVHFETMQMFMGLQAKSSLSEILSAVAQASEYSTIRFRQGEKSLYKLINKSPQIRFPIAVNLDLPAQKVSLIIQAILGSTDISWEGEMVKHRSQYNMDTQIVFKNASSLIRCIIDCQIQLGDSISIHSAMLLERSLGSKAWDDSPLQMKQIDGIGTVAVRKFVNAGIRCMDDLEATEAHRIEALVGRNPPFGLKILEKVRQFPKLRVSLHMQPSSIRKAPEGVKIQIKADIGFINEKPPQRFGNRPIYVCHGVVSVLISSSAEKLGGGQSLIFPALLTSHDQLINCYVMCDGIAGSLRDATVRPQIAPAFFPPIRLAEPDLPHQANVSKRREEVSHPSRRRSTTSDDFGDDGIDDDALLNVPLGDLEFDHIENYADPSDIIARKHAFKNAATKPKGNSNFNYDASRDEDVHSVQLANGKWACNHPCKDKAACKHLCCKTGLDRPRKKRATTRRTTLDGTGVQPKRQERSPKSKTTQTKLQLKATKRKSSAPVEELDLTQQEKKRKANYATNGPSDYRDLHQLHETVQGKKLPDSLHSVMHTKPAYCYSEGGAHDLSFLDKQASRQPQSESDYRDIPFGHVASQSHRPRAPDSRNTMSQLRRIPEFEEYMEDPSTAVAPSRASDDFGDDDSLLGAAMIGVADSQNLQGEADEDYDVTRALEEALVLEYKTGFDLKSGPVITDFESTGDFTHNHSEDIKAAAGESSCEESNQPFKYFGQDHDSQSELGYDKRPAVERRDEKPGDLKSPRVVSHRPRTISKDTYEDALDSDILDILDSFDVKPAKEEIKVEDKPVPDAFKDLEPWLFQEFGDIVELVDG